MKIIVTGCKGFLGARTLNVLKRNHQAFGLSREEADITKYDELKNFFENIKPDLVIHCASIADISYCERNNHLAYAANVLGTRNIASLAADYNAKLIYISSDQVYDYTGSISLREYLSTNPLNFYGRTKVLAENEIRSIVNKHHILRISWQYGFHEEGMPDSRDGLVDTLYKALNSKTRINANFTTRQYVTWVYDTIDVILNIVDGKIPYGTYNIASEHDFNDYELKSYILKKLGADQSTIDELLIETNMEGISLIAEPYNLKLLGYEMPSFEKGLERCLEMLK